MEIIKITDYKKTRKKITLEDNSSILLYNNELKKYKIEEGNYIDEETYRTIIKVLKSRAKERALYLIKNSDKTEKMIRDKLKMSYYPNEVIDYVVDYLKSYNFIDDKRYCRSYIIAKSKSKSMYHITMELKNKGIDKELIKEVLEEANETNDDAVTSITAEHAIKKLLKARKFEQKYTDSKEKYKILMYILSKGFSYDDINDAMESYLREFSE